MADYAPAPPGAPRPRAARALPAGRAFTWYGEAMLLWRRGPFTFTALALATIAPDLLLSLVPVVGVALAQVVVPILACGLLYGSLAADRGGRPRLADLAGVAGAAPGALAAVVASGVVVFAAEAIAARAFAGVDLLAPGARDAGLEPETMFAVYAAGALASLPVTFVPFAALFDGLPFRAAFVQSFAGFARNPAPLLLYGALSLVLLLLGWVTFGAGLLLALPWWAASSYAAWKDVFAVSGQPTPGR